MSDTLCGVDSINPRALLGLPFHVDFTFGYDDGSWPDAQQVAAELNVPCIRINVFDDNVPGDGSDSEPGDTSIAQAVDLTRKELAAGVWRPVKYCPASWGAQMVAAHSAAGVGRSEYRLVLAHYGVGEHVCSPASCGYVQADATQWAADVQGPNGLYDLTLAVATFLPSSTPPPIPHVEENDMVLANDGHTQFIVTVDSVGNLRKKPAPPGTNVEAIAASGTPNWGDQAALLATVPAAG